jgi:alpha-beta hydrolase superfamily lysophospholipase
VRIDGAKHELFVESDNFCVPALTSILQFFATP